MSYPIMCSTCHLPIDPLSDYHWGVDDETYHPECCPICSEGHGPS